MDANCKGVIHQGDSLKIDFDLAQCLGCNEVDCFGKYASLDPEAEVSKRVKEKVEAQLNAWNSVNKKIIREIFSGNMVCLGASMISRVNSRLNEVRFSIAPEPKLILSSIYGSYSK